MFLKYCVVGPGEYQVVKCGPSGHNIRCRPHLKATPIGMLIHGEKITVVEDVSIIEFLILLILLDENIYSTFNMMMAVLVNINLER